MDKLTDDPAEAARVAVEAAFVEVRSARAARAAAPRLTPVPPPRRCWPA